MSNALKNIQNNIVSGIRGTEIVSDVTNILGLLIASEFQKTNERNTLLRYCTTHRHVRGQYFDNPNYSAHFSVFCMASGGLDPGNYQFEIEQLNEHLSIQFNLVKRRFDEKDLLIRFYIRTHSEHFTSLLKEYVNKLWRDQNVEFKKELENQYYSTIQFKIFLKKDNLEIDLGDGGVVDWTQKLLQNKKHRLFISGIGLELIEKLLES